jgi:hypothetical protein
MKKFEDVDVPEYRRGTVWRSKPTEMIFRRTIRFGDAPFATDALARHRRPDGRSRAR